MALIPISEGLSLIVTRDWGGAGGGEGATVVAESDDAEDAGIIEPAMDDMTDAPLEGWNDEEPCWAVREEPHWVRM
jgi:hypothetical protein